MTASSGSISSGRMTGFLIRTLTPPVGLLPGFSPGKKIAMPKGCSTASSAMRPLAPGSGWESFLIG